ncbi:pantothenate synthetase [Candidatus Rickettsiella viridis]|uniref:Pantothenate synthetase n=1 Tax=Candidatus Rickettsiella viridis TaxID=676208 RepID=A0A2Z5UWC5_9COXI|nr:pantoate--beta-alanine ligase [Candidatus Rickettsiella viridis]BBB15808.1 pantothenate synthetase [Candidatus Rickettsiella viridis]
MNIVTSIAEWRVLRKKIHDKSIGFVHTMGHLHDGHLSLCTRSQQENDMTIAAIFINPTQFNRDEDFSSYPRTLEKDKSLLSKQKVDYLLLLDKQAIYPDDYQIQISETTELSQMLEGKFRPGHFNGMLTVVLKYLNIVKPTRAYYGEKDYQQLLLIKKMAQALFLETEIVSCLTVRAENGLALSSRNSCLTAEQREKAGHFAQMLKKVQNSALTVTQLENLGFKVDYIADQWDRRLAAVWLGDVRLIDNISFIIARNNEI